MMNTKKRWLAALLSVVMVVAMLPSMAFAATLPEVSGLKVDDKGVITWDKLTNSDGTLEEKGNYTVTAEKKAKNDPNPSAYDSLTVNAVDDTDAKVFSAAIDAEQFKAVTTDEEIRITVVRKVGGVETHKSVLTLAGKADPAAKGQVEKVSTVVLAKEGAKEMDGVAATITNLTSLTAGQIAPTKYTVTLYKNTVALNGSAVAVPSTAEAVKTVTVAVEEGSNTVVQFGSDVFKWDDNKVEVERKNNYFVTVVAQRDGYKDSKVAFSNSDVVPVELADATKVTLTLSPAAWTVTSTHAALGKYVATYQVKDGFTGANVGQPIVKEGASAEENALKLAESDLKSVITKSGKYFVELKVKELGKNVGTFYSASEDFRVDREVGIDATMADNGDITVKSPAIKDASITAANVKYTYTVLYKGQVVKFATAAGTEGKLAFSGAGENVKATIAGSAWSHEMKGMPQGVEAQFTKTKDKYNLPDFTVRLTAEYVGYKSTTVELSCRGALAQASNAMWVATKGNKAVAKWDAVKNATKYLVALDAAEFDKKDGKFVETTETTADLSKFLPEGYNGAATHDFVVKAVADGYTPSTTNSLKPDFSFYLKLTAVKNAKWDGSLATWSPVDGATSYTVKKIVNGKQVGPDCTTTGTSYQFKGLAKAGNYEFVVIANSDKADVVSSTEVKSPVRYIEGATVGTPYITKASKTATTVKLRWTAAEKAQVYRIYYKTKGMNSYKMIVKSVRGDATAKTIKGLKKGTRYSFKVKAVNSGAAAYSNVKVVTTTK